MPGVASISPHGSSFARHIADNGPERIDIGSGEHPFLPCYLGRQITALSTKGRP